MSSTVPTECLACYVTAPKFPQVTPTKFCWTAQSLLTPVVLTHHIRLQHPALNARRRSATAIAPSPRAAVAVSGATALATLGVSTVSAAAIIEASDCVTEAFVACRAF